MKRNSEILVDESGIEVSVDYRYEQSASQVEECHGYHDVGQMVLTELVSVKVTIAGRSIDILNMLTEYQKESIINQLTYE